MPSQKDVQEIRKDTAKASPKRTFIQKDWDFIADYVVEEHARRKRAREIDLEKHWKEIDRQLEMTPETQFKKLPNGRIDVNKQWMAEMELPLQAQALEILTSDARRMLFADNAPWFRAHSETTDEYFDRVNFKSLILGDEAEVPSLINQDNADKLVQGFLMHYYRQTDFFSRYDKINAEAMKYGMGIGRARMERKNVHIHEARGVRRETEEYPVLVPLSIKNVYLDDRPPSAHTSQVIGDAHILADRIKYENLVIAAKKGSNDPDDPDGGWMPKQLAKLEPDKDGFVEILEMEGDIVVPRAATRSFFIPGAIATVAVGDEGKVGVIRFRFRKQPFSSYLLHPYHYEHADKVYPTSPLMKGRPVQIMATDALNRLMDSAMLKNAPPIGYGRDDMTFALDGGPSIAPYAQWQTTDEVKVYDEIGGDPSALSGTLSLALNLYAELTGILPARIGAQTVSHTTAFAKDAELQRGAVRTVDYVKQTGMGPLTKWLDMSYRMAREALPANKDISFYIDDYGGFVEITKSALPENVSFEWFGSAGPAEEQSRQQAKFQALLTALQMDQINISTGGEPVVDLPAAIREVLREGKWTDVDAITRLAESGGGNQASPGTAGVVEGAPGTTSTALQGLAFGGR